MTRLLLILILALATSTAFAATSASLQVRLIASQTLTTGIVAGTASIDHANADIFTEGTGASQFQIIYSADITGTTTAVTDYDLAGVLHDAFGRTLTFTSIRALYIEAASTNAGQVVVGNGTHPVSTLFGATTDTVLVRPGCAFYMSMPDSVGCTVTATSADDLGVAASTGTVDYKIVIIGTGTAQ
jgi:hypothetical protein